MGLTLKSLLVRLGVDSSDFDTGISAAETKTKGLESTFDNLSMVGGGILLGATGAAVAGATALFGLGSVAAMAAGRVDELALVNTVLGNNLGISNDLIREQVAAVRAQGIEAAVAEEALAKMMQANLDVAGATDIARVAQDAAVIAGMNSSESMDAIIHGITTLNPLVLRGQGLIVDQQKAYDDLAASLGISATELSAAQKQQAMYNAVLTAGEGIQGSYDAAMQNPVKQLGSMKRLINDIAVAAGGPLLKGFSSIITSLSGVAKWLGAAVSEGGELRPFLDQAGVWFEAVGAKIGVFVTNAIKNLPKFIAGFKKAFDFLQNNKGIVVGILAALGIAVMAFGISVATAAWTALVPLLPVIAIMLAVGAVAYLVYEAWTKNWGGIQEKVALAKEIIVGIFQALTERIVAIWEGFMTIIRPIIEAFQAAFSGDWYTFGQKIREAWDAVWVLVASAVSNAWTAVSTAVSTLVTNVINFFKVTDWKKVGTDIVKGIANGLLASIQWVKDAAIAVAKAAVAAMKGFLGIKSPSTLFAGIGKNMMLGLAGGLEKYSKVPIGVTVNATGSIAGMAAGSPQGASGMDEAKLARLIRDALLQVID